MELKGKIVKVLPLDSGVSKTSGKEWRRATAIVEYGEPEHRKQVAVSHMKNTDEFLKLAAGMEVTMQVDVDSHEFNGRWYTSVNCWKWESLPLPSATAAPAAPKEDSDLPF